MIIKCRKCGVSHTVIDLSDARRAIIKYQCGCGGKFTLASEDQPEKDRRESIREHSGSKYLRKVYSSTQPGAFVECDVYRMIVACEVTNPGLQHAIKKIMHAGNRGKAERVKDLEEAIDAIREAINIERDTILEDERLHGKSSRPGKLLITPNESTTNPKKKWVDDELARVGPHPNDAQRQEAMNPMAKVDTAKMEEAGKKQAAETEKKILTGDINDGPKYREGPRKYVHLSRHMIDHRRTYCDLEIDNDGIKCTVSRGSTTCPICLVMFEHHSPLGTNEILCECPHVDCDNPFFFHFLTGSESRTTVCPSCGRQQAVHQVLPRIPTIDKESFLKP